MNPDQRRELLFLLDAIQMAETTPGALATTCLWASGNRTRHLDHLTESEAAKAIAGLRAKCRKIEREQKA